MNFIKKFPVYRGIVTFFVLIILMETTPAVQAYAVDNIDHSNIVYPETSQMDRIEETFENSYNKFNVGIISLFCLWTIAGIKSK